MRGGTAFTFVTDGIVSALKQATAAAGERDVAIAGGAATVNQYLAAGLLDELTQHLVPVVLGAGERLFDGVGSPELVPGEPRGTDTVTHITYHRLTPPDLAEQSRSGVPAADDVAGLIPGISALSVVVTPVSCAGVCVVAAVGVGADVPG
jgi:hypothetical protein